MKLHTPTDHPEAVGYTHGVQTDGPLLFVSGQTPKRPDGGPVAEDPTDQIRQVFANLRNVLRTAGADFEHVVHLRVFLADRAYRQALKDARTEAMGDLRPGITVVVCDIYDEAWVAEIEAVAELPARG